MTYNPYSGGNQQPPANGTPQGYGQYSVGGSGQYQYGDPNRYAAAAQSVQTQANGMAITSFILGLFTAFVSFSLVFALFTGIGAVVGLIFGIVGAVQAKRKNSGKGMAITGIILNSVALLISLVGGLVIALYFSIPFLV